MATIEFERTHSLGLKRARAAAQRVADEMAEEYGMSAEWEGNTLYFQRTGVSGEIVVGRDTIVFRAKLGFLLSALKPRIEETLHCNFDTYFG